MSNILEIKNLSKSYYQAKNKLTIIDDVSFSVAKGDNIALIGASGCGKSTFLQIIALLDKADQGEINYHNVNYANNSEQEKTIFRRDNIGFIYQFHYLMPEFTALENIMLPLLIQGRNKSLAQIEAIKLLEKMDLVNRAHHKPAELSGGEKQRIAIARGLIHQPEILLADEPTGNLDPKNAHKIFDLFIQQIKELQQTTIIVTHNLNLAQKFDKIITIKDGKLQPFK
jgi:lipoprotein-releasing system ATP-binding protein